VMCSIQDETSGSNVTHKYEKTRKNHNASKIVVKIGIHTYTHTYICKNRKNRYVCILWWCVYVCM